MRVVIVVLSQRDFEKLTEWSSTTDRLNRRLRDGEPVGWTWYHEYPAFDATPGMESIGQT